MLAHFASDFSPEVRYMYASAAVTKGHFVKRCAGVTLQVPDPVDSNSPLRYIMPIQMCAPSITANQEAVLGVALADISATTWGPVCIGGPCQVKMSASCTLGPGSAVGAASASVGAGVEIGLGTSPIAVMCWSLVQQTATASNVAGGPLMDCFIEPIRRAGCGGAYT